MNWRDGPLLAVIVGAVVAGGMLWTVHSRRLAQPGSQTVKPTRPPRWTAVLVLMPVVLLALVGLIALVRYRVLAEELRAIERMTGGGPAVQQPDR